MNDIGVSGASSGADILAVAKGTRSTKQDDGKGFIDALTSSLGNGRKSAGSNTGTDVATDANTTTGDNADDDTGAVKTAASNLAAITLTVDDSANAGVGMIDTSGANLANPAGLAKGTKASQPAGVASLSKSLIELQKAASAAADGEAIPIDGDQPSAAADPATPTIDAGKVQVPPTALDQLTEIAQQLADAATTNGQTAPVKGDGKMPAVKDGKDVQSTDDGKSASTQGSQPANTISDAWSLLNVAQPIVATQVSTTRASTIQASTMLAGKTIDDAKVQILPSGKAALADASDTALTLPDDGKGADAAQTFRLTRADGRGSALDLSISKSGDDVADVKVGAAAGGDAVAVTVLDSRRYLGLAANSNSALVAGTLAGDHEWSAAMQPGSALSNAANLTSTGKVVNTLKIQLRPDNLGDVTATMRLSGDQLSVDLKVQTSEAYRQLHADQSRMVDALRAQGYQVDNITVSMASNADQQSDSGRNSGSNQPQQQSLFNQGQGGDARPRGQNYSGQQANGNDGNRSSGERGVEDGAAGGVQRSRSGAVYL
ncbi:MULTISPECIES: flagellar hook-length control protein FliK [unclassified Rhizobium]|uniref:flagellar hook-length control protein FliK n=1 Tax=Rhizobium TaxID=379 RepID=UPI00084C374D|nr:MULTISPECIES: flagellar hook-length control protein FliK [unclassified Rhizobium]OED00422.1 chemotaxis protein [Rhizobium sp. YK2]QYA12846.1 flagellar hook-length control protein FliK [Rhizobium sp. AB2/73]UEQ81221.1 flagellar hook-length control protein FliK [Rhizobium sp. AB2/73]